MSRSQEQKELETPAMMVKVGMLRLVFAGGEKSSQQISGVSMPRMFSAVTSRGT